MAGRRRRTTSEEQLAAIAGLSSVLDRHAVDYWLFGGWAVDFHVGEVTREHGDIDVAAWLRDYDRIKAALEDAGWRHTPIDGEVADTRYRCDSALVEFTFVTDVDGSIVIPMHPPVVWSEEPFGDDRRVLHGVSTRTVPLALLRAGKAVPREAADEAAKDRADFEALSRVTE